MPQPGDPQSLNRYAYCLGNPLRYTDPTGYFTKNQVKQYLLNSNHLTEEEIGSLIENWKTFHAEWWNLLMEAEYGDILDANNATGLLNGITERWVGKFTEGKSGTFDFVFSLFEDLRWELGGDELLARNGNAQYDNPLALGWFYSDVFLTEARGYDRSDIILAHQRADGRYYAIAGTGVHYDAAGGDL